jgi:hypothetical protein
MTKIPITQRETVCAVTSLIVVCVCLTLGAGPAAAQNPRIQVGGHVSVLRLSELDTTDVGVGASIVGPLTPVVAIDGALTWIPGDDGADALERQHRTLGLIGLRATAVNGTVQLFARGRLGFLRFGEQDSVVCILIFPTPLGCRLATGYTAFAADLGGGASIGLGSSGHVRLNIEAGDLLVRYGLETLRPEGEITDGFVGHNPLVTIGLGWQF